MIILLSKMDIFWEKVNVNSSVLINKKEVY